MRHVLGVDLGMVSEPTALAVVEVNLLPVVDWDSERDGFVSGVWPVFLLPDGTETTKHPPLVYSVRHVERIGAGTSYPTIVSRTKELARRLQNPVVTLDATGVGKATVELFRSARLKPAIVMMTAADASSTEDGVSRVPKRDLVSTAQVLLQTGRLKIARALPLAEVLLRELQGFRMAPPARQGADFLSWREGAQDDLVFALAIALWVAAEKVKVPEEVWWGM